MNSAFARLSRLRRMPSTSISSPASRKPALSPNTPRSPRVFALSPMASRVVPARGGTMGRAVPGGWVAEEWLGGGGGGVRRRRGGRGDSAAVEKRGGGDLAGGGGGRAVLRQGVEPRLGGQHPAVAGDLPRVFAREGARGAHHRHEH